MSEYLEKVSISTFHYTLLISLALGWAFDAMCAGLISTVTAPLEKEWNLSPTMMGLLLSCWLVGMLLGGISIGRLADLIGRKKASITALLLFSVPTGLVATSRGPFDVAILRLLAGIGSSGYMVVASTLLSEYIPARRRGSFVAFLESSWAFGWLLAMYFGRILAPEKGWRAVFFAGFLPLIVLPLIMLKVPESLRYLEEKGRFTEMKRVLSLLNLKLETRTQRAIRKEKSKISELFSSKYRKRTFMLWIHWFCIVLAYWGIFLWLPRILYGYGISFVRSLDYAIIITLAQIPGYWSGALLIDKIGRKSILASYMTLAGIGSYLFAISRSEIEVLIWAIIVSFFNLGAWGATYAYTPELYPTRIRGTGAGSANSVGRVGGIVGPYLVGALLELTRGNTYLIFLVFSIVHIISAVTVALLGEETKGRILEEISE